MLVAAGGNTGLNVVVSSRRGGFFAKPSYERHFVAPPPPLLVDPPPMDLGRFEISKGPSNRGGGGPWTF